MTVLAYLRPLIGPRQLTIKEIYTPHLTPVPLPVLCWPRMSLGGLRAEGPLSLSRKEWKEKQDLHLSHPCRRSSWKPAPRAPATSRRLSAGGLCARGSAPPRPGSQVRPTLQVRRGDPRPHCAGKPRGTTVTALKAHTAQHQSVFPAHRKQTQKPQGHRGWHGLALWPRRAELRYLLLCYNKLFIK